MEENNREQMPVNQEEFEAMRQRYARELMAIRRSVDAMLDQNALLERSIPQMMTQQERQGRFDCQGDPIKPEEPAPQTPDSEGNGEQLSDEQGDLTPPNSENAPLTDTATIQVMVAAAQEAVPIEGAAVLISRDETDGTRTLIQAMITDSSGKTPILTVPAPSRELTEVPGDVYPFAAYRAAVTAPGFLPQVNNNVTVFGGMASLLSVALLPMTQPQVPPPNSNTADGSLIF